MVDGDKELLSLPGTSRGKLKSKDKEDIYLDLPTYQLWVERPFFVYSWQYI